MFLHSLTYPAIPIHRFLSDTVDLHPNYVAMTFNEIHFTYKDLNERVNRFAHALLKLGVEKGDRIAFLLVNSPTYVFAFFAVMKLGAVVVNLNVGIYGEELARCLNDSGAKAIVTLDLFAQGVYAVIKKTGVKTVILHSVFGLEKNMSLDQGVPQPRSFSRTAGLGRERGRAGRSCFSRGGGGASVHERLYRSAQGRRPDAPQYRGQRAPE